MKHLEWMCLENESDRQIEAVTLYILSDFYKFGTAFSLSDPTHPNPWHIQDIEPETAERVCATFLCNEACNPWKEMYALQHLLPLN